MGNQLVRLVSGSKKNGARRAKSKASKKQQEQEQERAVEQEIVQLALALAQQQKSMRLERAASQRNNNPNLALDKLPRSASSRPRSVSDPVVQPHELINGSKDDGLVAPAHLETSHFVLVHGAGNGAWCWYKTISLLEDAGFRATSVDLAGSGIDFTDPNAVTTLSQYVQPLVTLLDKLPQNEKVILVGHDFGGACISYAMELFSAKVAKAVFVSAAMVTNGQRASDIFVPELMSADDMLPKAQKFVYANGGTVPTALEFERSFLRDLFFNQSPSKDVALASLSMRPLPFAPTVERLELTEERYGSVRRYFVHTTEDRALTPALQDKIVSNNPPSKVFTIKGADHSPFFSKPQALHKLLLEIAQLGGEGNPKP